MRPTCIPFLALALCLALQSCSLAQAPGTVASPTPAGCCGQRMKLIGDAYVYAVPQGKASDGTPVPRDIRTEVYGDELIARADLAPGSYTVEILASENSFTKPGLRIFNIQAVSGGTPGDDKGDKAQPGVTTDIAKDVDLFELAGGIAKPYTFKATINHAGGPLRVVFKSSVDNAKFSAIRIFDSQGNKAAWLFADDIADLLKAPDAPPVIAGPILWKDASLPMDKRVADLVRRMSLREKIQQMMNTAPANDRLGIPAYNYWSEGLHGVARNGYATVFPQAIGMSATFDPDSLHAVGDVIATEARAKFNLWQSQGGFDFFGGRFRGLTFWSPNINIFRDPRWGRGQETYGEDPFLTGTMGVAFIRGLQGDDPKYYKVIATAKHFAVHSGPEPLRHSYNAAPPIRDFYETYLPHFEMAVRQGHVASIMGAYNRVYGAPACASDLLLKTLLRKDWGFDGYVVSDCGAISDIWLNHEVEETRAASAAQAVLSGCDLECGGDYSALPLAIDLNMVGEGAIDQALSRILLSRFKLGLFDPPEKVPYASIKPSENLTPEHAALALKMAHESIVLLKNDGTLPLNRSIRKIAVVGPNADTLLPLVGNYNGTPYQPITFLQGIKDAVRTPGATTQIVHVRGCDNAARDMIWQLVPDVCLRPANANDPRETGLCAEHFDNDELTGRPVTTRTEKQIDFRGMIEWTSPGIPIAKSSSRWTGEFVAPADGEYRLMVTGGTWFRFKVAGQTVTDEWGGLPAPAATTTTAPATTQASAGPGAIIMKLKAGMSVPLIIETHQTTGIMDLQFWWDRSDLDVSALAADRVKDADIILFAGGIDGRMEAEEGDSRGLFKGFVTGDRDSIELPPGQTALLKALAATGKPVIFINMTGSAVAIPWEAEHLNAIVQAWYPGQSGGKAIADVLFGDYNPSGRLPVTFYASTADLPPFTDYAMAPGTSGGVPTKGRTYRYFTGKPLYPFGHGLSYTSFTYANLHVSAETPTASDTVKVGIDIANSGKKDGDEVVQLYASSAAPAAGDPLERLIAFKRIPLRTGQSAHLDLDVPIASLRIWDIEKKSYIVSPGRYTLKAGPSSADLRASHDIIVK